jgi:transcriptional regulator with XRE-family HTH domain
MMKQILADRLTELREDLTKRTDEKWPMRKVAQGAGITQNMIERIEAGKGGTMEAYLALFNFYYNKGYNLNWLLITDNSDFSKYRVPENSNGIQIEKMLIKIESFKNEMNTAVDAMVMDVLINA